LAASLGAADAHLITLRAGCERLVFPSKLYGVAAVGRPAIFVGPRGSEPARLITAHGFGCAFSPDQAESLARTLREWSAAPAIAARFGSAAARFAANSGGVASAVAVWTRLLDLS